MSKEIKYKVMEKRFKEKFDVAEEIFFWICMAIILAAIVGIIDGILSLR
jgi:hypothetical protein